MSLPRFSVRNHVLVNMLMLVMLLGGAIFSVTLVKEMFPESRPTKLMISAIYPGVQPAEIEKAVTIKIEEAVHDIEGVEKVESLVGEGVTTISLTLLNEVDDVDAVLSEVETEVAAVQDLPDGLEKLVVKKFEPNLPVISVAIFGHGDEKGLKRAARQLQEDLQVLPGISRVELNGSRNDEISVEIIPDQLLKYDITFDEVALAIRETNLDISGGQIKGDRNTLSVRTMGEEMEGRQLEDIPLRTLSDGGKVYLRDVAKIEDTFVDTDLESYFNGIPSMDCVVYKTKTQDAIQIAQMVRAYIYGKQGAAFDPYGFEAASKAPWYSKPFHYLGPAVSKLITIISGRPDPIAIYEKSRDEPFQHNFDVALHSNLARFVEGRLDLLTRNGKMGLILVLISLYLFLNWRIAFWAATGLCVAFLGTFIVMWMMGSSINLLSMFGLIIVLGIIVDDAIVIGENIYRHVEEGIPPEEAAVKGAEEVMWPVIIAVATTIGAFVPMFFIKGQIGDFMRELPIVVIAALTVSLIEALVILPAHLSHLKKKEHSPDTGGSNTKGLVRRFLSRLGDSQEHFIKNVLIKNYERFLRFALRWRYVTLATAVSSVILAVGLMAGNIVEFQFIQKMDSETVVCGLEMPVGTASENTRQKLEELSAYIVSQKEVSNALMFVARQIDLAGAGAMGNNDQPHLGQIIIELLPADERDTAGLRSSEELLTAFREFSALSTTSSGVNSITWEAMSGGPGGKDIELKITGRDFNQLIEVKDRIKSELESYQGVFDIDDDFDEGKREIQLRLYESAHATGVRLATLGNQVRSAMYGRESRRLTRNREDVKIMVRYPEEFRENRHHLESMWIPAPTFQAGEQRAWIPLSEIAAISEGDSYTTIHRSNMRRSISVYAEVDQAVTSPAIIVGDLQKKFEQDIGLSYPGVQLEYLGTADELRKSFSSLKVAFPVALLIIYTMLAGLFRSYMQPLVVMSAIPFGLLGAIVGHYVTDNPITILSLIGMLALTGILVNDSLVLVDFINKRIALGLSEFEASVQGATLRLRAILLTTLTTVSGLLPLMFETSFQAKFLIPMAVTLTFGLGFATILTLLVVPTINLIFFDIRRIAQSVVGVSPSANSRKMEPGQSPAAPSV
ncbi:MAG TPA: efflux RND transporter permease subunit [Planctomycetaceae bacterium]|nr:efflux RND transporter permease subunit [Planctomycetaceae bacterium]